MNFKSIFAGILQGGSNGAVQGLQSQAEGSKISWKAVGVVAAFGALTGFSQALQSHPAVVTAQTALPKVIPPTE